MKKLQVNLKESYNIYIENSALEKAVSYIENDTFFKEAKRVVIISDSNVSKLYADTVIDLLKNKKIDVGSFYFKAGEKQKNLATIEDIYTYLTNFNISRSDFLIALGGGVTGDITGFAAATYLRGIPYVQIPTSLLAQIDSSIGGKTGVDLKDGKNLVGAFYQPKAVIIDPMLLKTLDNRFFTDGMAEAIKYGCIADEELFNRILNENPKDFLISMIETCLNIKKYLVESDEFDTGLRMLLNFGHTLGHAYEKLYDFSKYSHGEAIAIGMMLMVKAGVSHGELGRESVELLQKVLQKYGLPIADDMDKKKVIETALHDKKIIADNVNIVMLKKIGKAYIKEISKSGLEDFIFNVGDIL